MVNVRKHNPRTIEQIFFRNARAWFVGSLALKLCVFAAGVISILFSVLSQSTPFVIAVLSIVAEICAWRSDYLRGMADDMHRKLDMQDSFGWNIKGHEFAEIVMHLSDSENKEAMQQPLEEYFSSKENHGVQKALENLQESSWFSQHIAARMSLIYFTITVVLTTISIWLLIISVETVQNTNTLASIGRLVTSVVVLIFSLGLARSSYSYHRFSTKSAAIEKSARDLMRSKSSADVEAIHLWHDYQIARRTAPLLPTWLWKSMRDRLNEAWVDYRNG